MAQKDHTREIEVTELGMLQKLEAALRGKLDAGEKKSAAAAKHGEKLEKFTKEQSQILTHIDNTDEDAEKEGLRRELETSCRQINDEKAARTADNRVHGKSISECEEIITKCLSDLTDLKEGRRLDFVDTNAEITEEDGVL